MKEIIENKTFDMERTLYNSDGLLLGFSLVIFVHILIGIFH
nr:hypothetical protein [Acutalibacter muris]